jgi:SAM-dependent methyltransferase
MSRRWPRGLVAAIDLVNRRGKAVGVRLVCYTGKSRHFVHPKHLIDAPWHDWYPPHLRPDDVVLDVGCANGAHTLQAAGRARRVVGMDYDVRQLAVASAEARRRGVRNVAMPFPASTFDAALFLDVIEHLHPRQAVLAEIRRVPRRGSRLLVSGPNPDTRWRRRLRDAGLFSYSDPDHKVEYTADEFLTPWAGVIEAVGGLSLGLYARLGKWKCDVARARPGESTGFRVVARARP